MVDHKSVDLIMCCRESALQRKIAHKGSVLLLASTRSSALWPQCGVHRLHVVTPTVSRPIKSYSDKTARREGAGYSHPKADQILRKGIESIASRNDNSLTRRRQLDDHQTRSQVRWLRFRQTEYVTHPLAVLCSAEEELNECWPSFCPNFRSARPDGLTSLNL